MKKILITDDNSDYRQSIIEYLEFEPFDLFSAENGKEAIEMVHIHQPDIIICDMDMPLMNGLEVLAVLKSNDATSLIPFIFLTANTDDVLILQAKI